jgi:hypothetical protein
MISHSKGAADSSVSFRRCTCFHLMTDKMMMNHFSNPMMWATAAVVTGLAARLCAAPGGNPSDRLGSFNRSVFSFSDKVDMAIDQTRGHGVQ